MGEPPVTPADPTGIDEYAEVEIDRISPDWGQGVVATHTINGCTGLTVIDGRIRRSRLF